MRNCSTTYALVRIRIFSGILLMLSQTAIRLRVDARVLLKNGVELAISGPSQPSDHGGFLLIFGTQRTIFGTHSKVRYKTIADIYLLNRRQLPFPVKVLGGF